MKRNWLLHAIRSRRGVQFGRCRSEASRHASSRSTERLRACLVSFRPPNSYSFSRLPFYVSFLHFVHFVWEEEQDSTLTKIIGRQFVREKRFLRATARRVIIRIAIHLDRTSLRATFSEPNYFRWSNVNGFRETVS